MDIKNNKKLSWEDDLEGSYFFYKEKESDVIWDVERVGYLDGPLFSFDRKTILCLWTDYPHNFTPEQKAIFDKEQPYWAEFFKNRC